jgi:hypothetical protein
MKLPKIIIRYNLAFCYSDIREMKVREDLAPIVDPEVNTVAKFTAIT